MASDLATVLPAYAVQGVGLLYRVSRRAAWWVFGANALATVLIWVVSAPGAVLEPVRRFQPLPLLAGLAALALLLALSGPGAADGPGR